MGLSFGIAYAADADQPVDMQKVSIAVLYSDNTSNSGPAGKREAKNIIVGDLVKKFSSQYNIFLADKNLQEINAAGIQDLATTERADIISFFKSDPVDYIVTIDILPHQKNEAFLFYPNTTPSLHFKIIDIKNNKYLFNGKLTYKSTWASMDDCYGELHKQINAQMLKNFPL